mmetsp:Transcript_37346/g.119803  ORF Transcript_37346/g.119803 Transcript_37346/m.119803 type:complete len:124 (-) Transcript_37346:152-523(-)
MDDFNAVFKDFVARPGAWKAMVADDAVGCLNAGECVPIADFYEPFFEGATKFDFLIRDYTFGPTFAMGRCYDHLAFGDCSSMYFIDYNVHFNDDGKVAKHEAFADEEQLALVNKCHRDDNDEL